MIKWIFEDQVKRLSHYDISVLEAIVDFFRAVRDRDKDTVKKFLDSGMDVNSTICDDDNHYTHWNEQTTTLHIAV
jgi:hypothetical protein